MILNETVAAIAEAIREKTGKSDLIAPINFAEEIKGITAGGGDAPSGDDGWEYYKVGDSYNNLSWSEKGVIAESFNSNILINAMYYGGMILGGVLLPNIELPKESGSGDFLAIKVKGEGFYFDRVPQGTTFKDLPDMDADTFADVTTFFNSLTPCTKEEFEALILM